MRTQWDIDTLRDYFDYTGRRIYEDYQRDSRKMGIWFHRFNGICSRITGDWSLRDELEISRFTSEYNEWVEEINNARFNEKLSALAAQARERNRHIEP